MEKKRITIIGFGWASAGFINTIDNDKYDITIISKNNFKHSKNFSHNERAKKILKIINLPL